MKYLKRKLVLFTLIFCCMVSNATPVKAAGNGWVKKGTVYKYKENNTYVKNQIKKIKGKYYYFNKKGIRTTGWVKYKGRKYYFDLQKGYAYIGKKRIGSRYYIFAKNGYLIRKVGFYKRNGKKYYVLKDGHLAVGPLNIKNKTYFFRNNGQLVNKDSLCSFNGKKYYVNKQGKVVKERFITINMKKYYFDLNGEMVTGWKTLSSKRYFFDANGVMRVGFLKWNDSIFYFNSNGQLVVNSYITENGNTYYADARGFLKKNCWYDGHFFDNAGRISKNPITYTSSTKGQVTKEMLDGLNLVDCTKLMVVAHPDDETIWGGAHLADKGYFVLCLTNGDNSVRKKEFETVISVSGNKGLILTYPDLVNGVRSDWSSVKSNIAKDLDTVLNYKYWGMVVTHNPDGEYGHIHHKLTSELMTQSYYRNRWADNLYYFGKYYGPSSLTAVADILPKVPARNEQIKRQLFTYYKSQPGAINSHIHLAPYENWIHSTEW